MRRFMNSAAVFLIGAYVVTIYGFSPAIYTTLIVLGGFWFALAISFTAFGIWGSIFYLILLQLDTFEHVRKYISQRTGEKKPGFFARIFRKGGGRAFAARLEKKIEEAYASREKISPKWLVATFIFLNPLFAVPLVRLSFPRERWAVGLMWVWIGMAAVKVVWFFPIYGGVSIVIRLGASLLS